MALIIVFTHVSPYLGMSAEAYFWTRDCFARVAVPFFFVSSGFFLFRKMSSDIAFSTVRRYWVRILRVYVVWTLVYLPLPYVWDLIFQDPAGILHGIMTELRNAVFTTSFFHLWFLRSLLVSVPLVALCFWRGWRMRSIFACFACTYVINLLATSYLPVYHQMAAHLPALASFVAHYEAIIPAPPNGLCFGALFVSIGACAAFHASSLSTMTLHWGLLLSLLAFSIEGLFVSQFPEGLLHDGYIILPILMFFLFASIGRIELAARPIYLELRRMSALIYYAHVLFFYWVLKLENSQILPAEPMVTLGATIVLSLVFAKIVTDLSEKSAFSFLKIFF